MKGKEYVHVHCKGLRRPSSFHREPYFVGRPSMLMFALLWFLFTGLPFSIIRLCNPSLCPFTPPAMTVLLSLASPAILFTGLLVNWNPLEKGTRTRLFTESFADLSPPEMMEETSRRPRPRDSSLPGEAPACPTAAARAYPAIPISARFARMLCAFSRSRMLPDFWKMGRDHRSIISLCCLLSGGVSDLCMYNAITVFPNPDRFRSFGVTPFSPDRFPIACRSFWRRVTFPSPPLGRGWIHLRHTVSRS
mmetsp:Transcript_28579/g.84149  ORF Transcript_28579/g.84149 Transcript_28579/m.84149 type:complete len:249 (+) Transcript_28579:73-819(+)